MSGNLFSRLFNEPTSEAPEAPEEAKEVDVFDRVSENFDVETFADKFHETVADNFLARIKEGKYEITDDYAGDNLGERVVGEAYGPYETEVMKGPKAQMQKAAGSTWDYNPVDVRADKKYPAAMQKLITREMMAKEKDRGIPVPVLPDRPSNLAAKLEGVIESIEGTCGNLLG